MSKYQEIESPETKRCRGLVIQKEAELEAAQQGYCEARKAQWKKVSLHDLSRILDVTGPVSVISETDWETGCFEYAVIAEREDGAIYFGGFTQNDRFRSDHLYVTIEACFAKFRR